MVRRYDQEAFSHHPSSIVRWVENTRVAAVIKQLDAGPEDRILDAGCGSGKILGRLSGKERHGVDLSKFMVDLARQRLDASVKVIRGDAEHLPYPDGFFDRVVASSLFSHVLNPEQVVAELKRVTKPGGRVVISVSDEDQIERGMRWVKALGLQRRFFGTTAVPGGDHKAQVYNIEYHLRRFSLKRLREVVGGNLSEAAVIKVPTFIFPVHWIAVYTRN